METNKKRAVTQGLIFSQMHFSTFYIICNNFKYINIPAIKLSGQATIFFIITRFYFYNIHVKDILGNTSNHDFHRSNAVFIIRIHRIYIHSHFRISTSKP